jgi:hypothetical protein
LSVALSLSDALRAVFAFHLRDATTARIGSTGELPTGRE